MKHYKINLPIYCDMDGVLADFFAEPNAIEKFKTEKDFFYNLKPMLQNVNAIAQLIADGNEVYILSTSPHARADQDKMRWLHKYLPMIAEKNIILIRPETSKANYRYADGILLDDYGKNIREWVDSSNLAFKIKGDGDIALKLELLEFI